ncbi:MAG TPA: NAD(P)/FAD-dependent oxidoreductase [Glaciibacter sp.]|nr:NAD(P)/FAD-dependent oxidoreductase [Glaciibacter sp.]
MRRILIVGGGYTGFYTAWKLEKLLKHEEAEVILVDPLPYMIYQPFLPEVIAGSIEARHSVVSFRRHLKKTKIVTAKVMYIDHANKTVTITRRNETNSQLQYDIIVITAGAVSRTFPIPGVAEEAIGLKSIEEAVFIRDTLIANLDEAAGLPPGPARDRLLTVTFIGGGYAGIEGFGELRALATALLPSYPELRFEDTHFHLIEATNRILPEVSLKTSEWVVEHLAARGAQIHLNTQLLSAVNGVIELSSGESFESALIVWTAGVMANPSVTRHTDLPVDDRGRLQVRPDLRVGTAEKAIEGAWGGGDNAAVPDLTGGGVGGFTVPNAQHAVRQGKLLAKNITASLRGKPLEEYSHKNLGAVATLGLGSGVFQSGNIVIKGFPAWVMHRGYHALAIPSWERKWRVLWGWWHNLWLGRDTVGLRGLEMPRATFQEFATRPRNRDATESGTY